MHLIEKLSKQEKLLAIDVLMTDMRMHWGRSILGRPCKFRGRFIGWDSTRGRRKVCLLLVHSLFVDGVSSFGSIPGFISGFTLTDAEIHDMLMMMAGRLYLFDPDDDGRWLRAPWKEGGYEDLEQIHLTPHNEKFRFSWKERSPAFR